MIYFLFAKFNKPIQSVVWDYYLNLLPSDLLEKSTRYVRWQDQHAFVLGKILLLECFKKIGLDHKKIHELQYNQYGKPFLNGNFDFNISHSGGYIVCAIGKEVKLGVDVEVVSDIEFDDFVDVMTEKQWSSIMDSDNPRESFFRFWTIKESIIKAEGKGMSIPLLDITPHNNIVNYKGKIWHLKEFSLGKDNRTCIATDIINPIFNSVEMDFYNGIKEVKHFRY